MVYKSTDVDTSQEVESAVHKDFVICVLCYNKYYNITIELYNIIHRIKFLDTSMQFTYYILRSNIAQACQTYKKGTR